MRKSSQCSTKMFRMSAEALMKKYPMYWVLRDAAARQLGAKAIIDLK